MPGRQYALTVTIINEAAVVSLTIRRGAMLNTMLMFRFLFFVRKNLALYTCTAVHVPGKENEGMANALYIGTSYMGPY